MPQCPFANLLDPSAYANGMPYGELRKARDSGPIVYCDDPVTGVPYWLVTRREVLDRISKDPKTFSSATASAFPMEFDPVLVENIYCHMIINMDPPQHMQYRKIVRRAFTPKAVDSYEPRFREHTRRIVDSVVGRGECEFVEEVAAELPLLAILELLGIPLEDRKDFFHWTNTMIFADDPDMATSAEEGQIAAANVLDYARRLAAAHRVNPKKNAMLTALLDSEVAGEALTEEEFCWFFVLLLVGGNESTRTVIAHGMRLLMENPEQLQYLVDNPSRIAGACEEVLRYNTAFIAMRRTATEDVVIDGQQIRRGDKIILHYHTVNHDEYVAGDDAMTFDVRRPERMPDLYNQHRAFGIGQHFCIGSHLARLELRVMLEEVILRLRNPRFAAPVRYVRSYFANAIKAMPITFDASH